MRTFYALKKGAAKSVAAYSFILVMWLITFSVIWLVAMQLKSEFKGTFGDSMLKDTLLGGFDLGIAGDMGNAFLRLISQLASGTGILLLAGIILYSFFAGGLFTRFTTGFGNFRVSDYFKSSAHYFLPFIGIGFLMMVVIVLWTLIIIVIPVSLSGVGENGTQSLAALMIPLGICWSLGMPVLLLAADHSRRWMTTTGTRKIFKAFGAGFRSAFTSFFASYVAIFVILLINVLFGFFMVKFVTGTIPEKGITIFLFFIATQLLILIKLWLKAWRYATVTELVPLPGQE
jgi:hypothetical protein